MFNQIRPEFLALLACWPVPLLVLLWFLWLPNWLFSLPNPKMDGHPPSILSCAVLLQWCLTINQGSCQVSQAYQARLWFWPVALMSLWLNKSCTLGLAPVRMVLCAHHPAKKSGWKATWRVPVPSQQLAPTARPSWTIQLTVQVNAATRKLSRCFITLSILYQNFWA